MSWTWKWNQSLKNKRDCWQMHLYASNSLPVNSLCQFQLFKFARNCTSAGATFGNYHRFSSLRTSPLLTCDFDLSWSCLLGAGEVPCAASVPASICLLDPRDHQVPLPHDLELVGRGQVQELAILDPPEDIICTYVAKLDFW